MMSAQGAVSHGGVVSTPVEKEAAAGGGHPENEKQTTAFFVVAWCYFLSSVKINTVVLDKFFLSLHICSVVNER